MSGDELQFKEKKRKFLQDADKKAFQTMLRFEEYLAQASLTKIHAELIKIRVSQINGCSYCIDKHIQDAIQYGEEHRRIHLLAVWHEVSCFSKEERIILGLCDCITLIHQQGVPDDIYNQAIAVLGQQYTTEVMMAIIAMNAWNRVGITTGRSPE
jgi:AhpD family alkylhydroperoxidase